MTAALIYHPDFQQYRFHPDHPFNPVRLAATYDLIRSLGLLPPDALTEPRRATEDELRLFHAPHYVELVAHLSQTGQKAPGTERLGLGTEDNPVFLGMHEAASLAVGGTLTAAHMVAQGQVRRALNLAGGLHHAGPDFASGFCIYNDVAIAIRWLRQTTPWRILYVDLDAHHADGVQNAFYQDPGVFVLSFHESGQYLFPGTGAVEERGDGPGLGYTLNVPLAPATDDDSWLELFDAVVPRVLQHFRPDLIVSQHGVDGHYGDPLADLCATTRFYGETARRLSEWADQYCEGRWIATGGGGYQVLGVVPRVWTLLWSVMARTPLAEDTAIPADWLAVWQPRSPSPLPTSLFDAPGTFPPIRDLARIRRQNEHTLATILEQAFDK
ncbi:MAG: acetoin utilization protein AcuC [Firmicutes bacterium]|nr:acetoin utilization protein AcuC [Bacillota bacterium]